MSMVTVTTSNSGDGGLTPPPQPLATPQQQQQQQHQPSRYQQNQQNLNHLAEQAFKAEIKQEDDSDSDNGHQNDATSYLHHQHHQQQHHHHHHLQQQFQMKSPPPPPPPPPPLTLSSHDDDEIDAGYYEIRSNRSSYTDALPPPLPPPPIATPSSSSTSVHLTYGSFGPSSVHHDNGGGGGGGDVGSLLPPPPPTVATTTNDHHHHHHLMLLYDTASNSSPQYLGGSSSSGGGAGNGGTGTNRVYGRLTYKDTVLNISDNIVEIGRNSSTSSVHFHVGKSSFVSRKHLQVAHIRNSDEFLLTCLSKNGVFVDDVFQRKSSQPLQLPKTCTFRFPSTTIRILFESTVDDEPFETANNKTVENSNVIYAPLKITIPDTTTDKKSPFPSPTGTISAANSCPTSPRQGFHDYQYNYNNNNFTIQDPFQTPSTSSLTAASTNATAAAAATNDFEKPPYSYAQLIVQSISSSLEKQLTLSGIYSFISKHYPYYRKEANKGWQNSIRHNLSLNRYFIKVARSQDEPGKGSFWRIDPTSESKLIDQSYKKRRQRGNQCFRTPYGMPRSAPVSPSHINTSGNSSPLHDIVLQSAPGSPGASYNNHSNEGTPNPSGSYASASHQIVQQSYGVNSNPFRSYVSPTSSTINGSGGGGGGNGASITGANTTITTSTNSSTSPCGNHAGNTALLSKRQHTVELMYADQQHVDGGGGDDSTTGMVIDDSDIAYKRVKYPDASS